MAAGSRTIGGSLRYETILKLASGGMATVYVGTVRGALGFRQLVAIKKPHPHLVGNADFRRELLAEAQLASMIHHANVVDVRDVELDKDNISLVMDYIEGASLGELLVAASKGIAALPPAVAVRIVLDACAGLHAAHELTDDKGRFIGLVHRDVSPQNILVGTDGVARVTDFGIAKIARRQANTEEGQLKGTLAYMAPEYLQGETIDRRFDVFGMGVVLWEAITGKRLFRGDHEAVTLQRVLSYHAPAVSSLVPQATPALDHVVAAAVEKKREDRFQTAAAMGAALETAAREAGLVASHTDVAALVRAAVGADLDERRTLIRARMAMEPAIASVGPQTPGPATERDINSTLTSAPPTTLPETAPMGSNTAPNVQSNTLPNVAATMSSNAVASNTAPIIGSATQPLTSPIPTLKEHGATLISSPPAGSQPRTLSSAPVMSAPVMALPEPSNPHLRVPAPAHSQPAFDDMSVSLPVRSNGIVYAIAAGALALAVASGVIYVALNRSQNAVNGDATSASGSASAANVAGPHGPASAAALSASEPATSAGSAAPFAAASAKTAPTATAQKHVPAGHPSAAGTATAKPTSTTTTTTTGDAPPPNPYKDVPGL